MGKAFDKVFSKLKETYKVEAGTVDEVCKTPMLTLDSPSLNYIFGGGFPLGRVIMLHGKESGGKSTLSTYIASQVQRKYDGKNIVVYFDFERTFNEEHARTLGLDVSNNFYIVKPDSAEDCFMQIKEIVDTGEVGLVILDSIGAISAKSLNEDPNKATFGAVAKALSSGLKYILPTLDRNKCSLIMINQERASMEMYGPGYTLPGGTAIKYYSSWTGRLTKKEDIKDKNEIKGIVMRVKNTKNKIANPFREALIKLYFDNGIDSEDEYLDYLVSLGLVVQKGAWFSNEEWGMKVSGKNGMAQFLKERPELFEEVKKQINDIILGRNVLDDHQTIEKGEVLDNGMDTPPVIEDEDSVWEGLREVEE